MNWIILILYILPMLIAGFGMFSEAKENYDKGALRVGDALLAFAFTFVPVVNWICTYVVFGKVYFKIERWWDSVKDRPLGK